MDQVQKQLFVVTASNSNSKFPLVNKLNENLIVNDIGILTNCCLFLKASIKPASRPVKLHLKLFSENSSMTFLSSHSFLMKNVEQNKKT